jgi:anti-anti-sigma regulatory factor
VTPHDGISGPVLVHPLPRQINATNIDEFRDTLAELMFRHGSVVLDCSELELISSAGMRVLEGAARRGTVTLIRPAPIVHLLAEVFGLAIAWDDSCGRA